MKEETAESGVQCVSVPDTELSSFSFTNENTASRSAAPLNICTVQVAGAATCRYTFAGRSEGDLISAYLLSVFQYYYYY